MTVTDQAAMTHETVLSERRGDVGIIRLNEPSSLNALSRSLIEDLSTTLDDLAHSCRAIILTGEGRAFCSGAKLQGEIEEDVGLVLETHINPFMMKLRNLPVPWLSAVRGAAAGAGCAIALAADMVVASESAYFLQAFVRIGLVPDSGATHLLTRTIGRVRTMEMMMLGDKLPAAQALEWGLINRVVEDGALESTAFELAERLARGPTRSLQVIRKMVWAAVESDWETLLRYERDQQKSIGQSADATEGISAFVEKRAARFRGT